MIVLIKGNKGIIDLIQSNKIEKINECSLSVDEEKAIVRDIFNIFVEDKGEKSE